MLPIEMARGARKIVEQNIGLRPGERVLIVTDTGRDFTIATALAAAVDAAGGEFSIILTRPLSKPGDEPPAPVAQAMTAADVVIAPTSRTIFHTRATIRATKEYGTRVFTLSEARPDTLITGLIECDFLKQKPLVDALAARMAEGKSIRITSPAGTDLHASIEGRLPVANPAICHNPGEKMGASVEVYIAPVEGTTEGVFVCDASSSMIGLVREPIKIEVKGGKAVSISGGAEARRLREIIEGVGHPDADNIAEIAFGLNPKARLIGNIIEDEGKYGTGHVALGNNEGFGGVSKAPIHIDMVYWKPTAWIDGQMVFKDGELIIR
ncbi:MAG: aminopeptidase [Firmicutes bacterium]|nr:aminopeptidase [Bacillota bacterium]